MFSWASIDSKSIREICTNHTYIFNYQQISEELQLKLELQIKSLL